MKIAAFLARALVWTAMLISGGALAVLFFQFMISMNELYSP